MSNTNKERNKKRVKLYKKVRNNSSWGAIAFFLSMIVLFDLLIVFISGFVLQYIWESKFAEAYESVEYLSDIYEYGMDNAEFMDYISSTDSEFIVTDKTGKIIYQQGENTCGDAGGTIALSNGNESYVIYEDSKAGFIYPGKNGTLNFRLKKFLNWTGEYDEYIESAEKSAVDTDTYSNIGGVYVSYNADKTYDFLDISINTIKLPVWAAADINGGEQQLIAKAYMTVNMRDNVLACELLAGMFIVGSVICLVMLLYVIRGAVNYRRIVKIFYSDPITSGHNWMWYIRNGEDYIQSSRTKKESFAVVNLVFRNYRNYCLCHSVSEGEELLAQIDKVLSAELDKKEICAHAATSSFALLLNCSSREELTSRLGDILKKLQNIDSEHDFVFHVGVDIVEPETNPSGRIVRRKDFHLENAYNNASSARAALGSSEETGIRIFDKKLLDEQRWNDIVHEKQISAIKNEEFVVYYQPKYDPRTNTLRGAEALIRWESPEYGFVTPGRFIPIFEKNGFITEIDHYMISHVSRDQRAWLDSGYKCVPVSVNVSRAHFVENDLAEQIRDIVDEADCPHELIEIELTESAFFDDKNAMIETIKKLKSYGFAVSMDDFGAGYSSLNSLKDMPLDVLKLDADFFRGENAGERGEIVVSEAIRLAKNLEMRTVAEGVEEQEQVDFLAEQGCDMIQGYFYAKPMPKDEYIGRMGRISDPDAETI